MTGINQLRCMSAQPRVAQPHRFRRQRSQLPANRSRGIVVAHDDKYSTNVSTPGWACLARAKLKSNTAAWLLSPRDNTLMRATSSRLNRLQRRARKTVIQRGETNEHCNSIFDG